MGGQMQVTGPLHHITSYTKIFRPLPYSVFTEIAILLVCRGVKILKTKISHGPNAARHQHFARYSIASLTTIQKFKYEVVRHPLGPTQSRPPMSPVPGQPNKYSKYPLDTAT